MAMSMSTTYTGRVVSVNPKGLKLDGHDDWYNVSKFATDVILPERGDTVTVVVDGKGFLRAVQSIDGPSSTNGTSHAPLPTAGRETTITRLAVLKAAAEFGAARPSLKSGDVLAIAESWERWVLRDGDPAEDLEEAF